MILILSYFYLLNKFMGLEDKVKYLGESCVKILCVYGIKFVKVNLLRKRVGVCGILLNQYKFSINILLVFK